MIKFYVDYFEWVGVILNKKTYMLLGAIFGLTLLLSSGILVLTNAYKNNRSEKIAEEKEVIKEINDGYKEFKAELEEFGDERSTVLGEISNLTNFYGTMEENYSKVVKHVVDYEQLVEKIDNAYPSLKTNCIGKTYYQYEPNNKCIAFVSGLEQLINTYIRNVEVFNKRIEEYNKWTTEEANKGHKKLDDIVSKKYTTYVDLNKDKKYEGQTGE